MSSLAMVILSAYSAAISSSAGATWRHGPHQVAQKSTSTGLSLLSTSVSKVSSVTVMVAPATGAPWGCWGDDWVGSGGDSEVAQTATAAWLSACARAAR